ncbi:maltose O-acetyltransferase [compost metagenome]
MGHVMLSENVFVGPSATVTSRIRVGKDSKISIGSVVTKDVPANTRVTGNFAVDHEDWIEFVKSVRSK